MLVPLGLGGCSLTASLDELQGGEPSCDATRANCDGNVANGCETDLETSAAHCGACGTVCPDAPSGAPQCVDGSCTIACDVVAANCDGSLQNGCETPIEKDPENCGECKHVCGTDNTTSSECVSGACELACLDGYASCDENDANGCEAWLDDAASCGLCGRSCLGVACTSKDCVNSPELDNATAIAASEGVVYVATTDANCSASPCTYSRHFRSITETGGIEDLFVQSANVTDIAIAEDGKLYLATPTALLMWEKDATGPQTLHPGSAENVEVDAEYVYFHSEGKILDPNVILRMPLGGGTAEKLADVDDGWKNFLSEPLPLALGGGTLYYHAEKPTDGIYALSVDGGAAELVEATNELPVALAADATAVYFVLESQPSLVFRASAGSVTTLVTSQSQPVSLLTDGSELWWWNQGTGALVRSETSGDAVTTLFQAPAPGSALVAFDADAVYWLTTAGQLNRLAR